MASTCRSPGAEIARGAFVPSAVLITLAVAVAGLPAPARAMHLAEGTLPAGWSAAWWAVTAVGLAVALDRLRGRAARDAIARPLTGTMAAFVLVLSSIPIPVPVAGSSGHACGTGLAAILIGPVADAPRRLRHALLSGLSKGTAASPPSARTRSRWGSPAPSRAGAPSGCAPRGVAHPRRGAGAGFVRQRRDLRRGDAAAGARPPWRGLADACRRGRWGPPSCRCSCRSPSSRARSRGRAAAPLRRRPDLLAGSASWRRRRTGA